MKDIKGTALKYAVKNAYEHNGTANVGAVIGKAKALFPDSEVKDLVPIIKKVVDEVNVMTSTELEKKFKAYEKEGWELKRIEKEKTLPELDWLAEGEKVTTRMAPNPSGAMHFGHARAAILNDEYVRKYGGKYIVRFDDTDPKIKTPVEGIEKEFLEEFKWLGIKVHETANASDRLDRYYEIIEKLLKDGNAYICNCDSEEWRKLIWESKACPCRDKKAKEHMKTWKDMLKHKVKEGEAVVRLKTDLNEKDSSLRDWWLARVVDEVNHPNKKVKDKHVWPSYNLASAIDDHDMKINFMVRGQEHRPNELKQRILYDYFEWEYPHTAYTGKISRIGEMILSKSKIKVLMEEQGLDRDDDPRLATLKSFRRKGFKAEAIRKIIVDMGIHLNEAKISTENLAAANKILVGEVSEFPFFEEAIEVEVINVTPGKVALYGDEISFRGPIERVTVDKNTFTKHKAGKVVRFKQAFNAKLTEITDYGGKADFVSYTKAKHPTISWVIDPVDVEVLMGDGSVKKGFSAPGIVEAEGIIYLENLGYVNIEEKDDGITKCIFSYT